jgi:hypothetical protein
MSTERQKQASRSNGSKSHGPVTPEGKLASSRNAITHGMLSTTIVLKGESTDRFLGLLTALLEEFQPQTPFEESLIENMAVVRWRQMRIWGMEKAAMEHEMRRQAEMPNSTSLEPDEDAATRAAIAFRTLSDDSRSLELINRYESRYDRQYLRAHRRFLEVHDRRTPPAPQPTPVNPPPVIVPPPQPETPSPENIDISKGTQEVVANNRAHRSANSTHRQNRVTFESVFMRFHPWPMVLTCLWDKMIRQYQSALVNRLCSEN